jgi:hypothetical protein
MDYSDLIGRSPEWRLGTSPFPAFQPAREPTNVPHSPGSLEKAQSRLRLERAFGELSTTRPATPPLAIDTLLALVADPPKPATPPQQPRRPARTRTAHPATKQSFAMTPKHFDIVPGEAKLPAQAPTVKVVAPLKTISVNQPPPAPAAYARKTVRVEAVPPSLPSLANYPRPSTSLAGQSAATAARAQPRESNKQGTTARAIAGSLKRCKASLGELRDTVKAELRASMATFASSVRGILTAGVSAQETARTQADRSTSLAHSVESLEAQLRAARSRETSLTARLDEQLLEVSTLRERLEASEAIQRRCK